MSLLAACLAAVVAHGSLTPGAHVAGFRTLYKSDPSRTWSGGGRPIRVNLWYPARADGSGRAMTHEDYLHYEGPPDFRTLNDALERSDRASWIGDLAELVPDGRATAARLFASPEAARLGATAADGRFPVVLYASGKGGRSDSNAELGEYLASHGYVVATVPRLGPSPLDLELGSSPAEVSIQERDLAFAWTVVRALSFADASTLATAGHSAGGIVALQFAMLHPEVKAVVGLDGSYGMSLAKRRNSAIHFPSFEPARLAAALLDLRRASGVQGAFLDPTVVDALRRSDRWVAVFARMYHGDFTEFAPIAIRLDLPWKAKADGRTRESGLEGNQHAYRSILAFLDATLRGVPDGLERMSSELRSAAGVRITHHPPEER
jgi:pimeloyl-ACP methyl ester carboxylesterase